MSRAQSRPDGSLDPLAPFESNGRPDTRPFAPPISRRGWLAIVVVLLAVLVLTSTMSGLTPTLPAVTAGGLLFAVVVYQNPSWIIHSMLVVLFMTSIPEVPRGVRVGGIFIYFYEFLIFGSVLYAISLLRGRPEVTAGLRKLPAVRIATAFIAMVAVGIGIAILKQYPFWDIQYDAKPVVELMMVLLVASVVVALNEWQRYTRTLTWILIFSAALTVYASATGFAIWGRSETAQLVASGGRVLAGGSDAVRFITQTAPLALAVLLASVAVLLLGAISVSRVLPMMIPALVITILSFSRNTLLALAGTFVVVFLIALTNGLLVRLLLRVAMVPFVVAFAAICVVSLGGALGAQDWIDTQATGYSNRVLAGLDQANERDDTSANYREQETEDLRKVAANHPTFGGGFGTHYKPPTGKRGTFTAYEGTMYSHNAYNWLYLKIGIVGLAGFLALTAACVLPALRRKSNNTMLATGAATLAGLSVASFVAPMPIEQPSAALLGMVMGICIGASVRSRNAEFEHSVTSSAGFR
jgi:O-antigen ligase